MDKHLIPSLLKSIKVKVLTYVLMTVSSISESKFSAQISWHYVIIRIIIVMTRGRSKMNSKISSYSLRRDESPTWKVVSWLLKYRPFILFTESMKATAIQALSTMDRETTVIALSTIRPIDIDAMCKITRDRLTYTYTFKEWFKI